MPPPALQPTVIWLGRVGDMVLVSALLSILHRRYGLPCYLIGAGSWPRELYGTHPDVGRIDCLHRYTAFALDPAWWRTLGALRASRAAPVYVCEYHPRKLVRVRRLLRWGGVDAAHCLWIAEGPSFARAHWVDRLVDFGRLTPPALAAGEYPWPDPPPPAAPRLVVSPGAQADGDAWLEAHSLADGPLVLVQPGNRRTMRGRRLRIAAGDDKAWPIERWAALLQRLHAHLPQAHLVLCGAPRESRLLEWIAAAARLPRLTAAGLPLTRLLALCARAHSMISVDTGPAHAAAALSLPLVVLFGGHAQAEWLPRSADGSPVVGVGGPPESQRLAEVSVERVFAAWCALGAGLCTRGSAAGSAGAGLTRAARATAR